MITFINIAAVIIGPIVAVYIGQWLQVRAEKRKEKMHIFNILMSSRLNGFASFDAVYALNSIDIVFEKERKVRAAWKEYIDRCTVVNPESPTKTELEKMQLATYKLLEEMARCLGYKDKAHVKEPSISCIFAFPPVGVKEREMEDTITTAGWAQIDPHACNVKQG